MTAMKTIREVELEIITAFIKAALEKNYLLSVYDGGEWVVRKSNDLDTIVAALFSTGSDTIRVWTRDDKKIGWVQFVYGNTGWDVIHDSNVGPEIDELLKEPNRISDEYSM